MRENMFFQSIFNQFSINQNLKSFIFFQNHSNFNYTINSFNYIILIFRDVVNLTNSNQFRVALF